MPENLVSFGEVGLSGEVRAVSQREQRLKEAAKLGFTEALLPPRRARRETVGETPRLHEIAHLHDLVDFLGAGDAPRRGRS
jgi:DNA repair protein RadA/Sms